MPQTPAATFRRADTLARLGAEPFDVVVIGGGITGAGVALDAASRGLRTALVERDDFASGTSSKSSKLVHGGLRYLQQKEFRLVYENLSERQIILRNAPHLVRVLPFLIPVLSRDGLINPKIARALGWALWLYDLTGGARVGKLHKRLDKERALAHMPTMPADKLAGAYLYYDAQADDARLTLTIARSAAEHGAVIANRAEVTGLRKDASGRVRGATIVADGNEIEVQARVVVNAAGVWADDVRALDEGMHPHSIRPAKGVHITVPWGKVRNDIAAIVPVPKDKRSIFVVPWGDFTYIGTTDTDYDGPIDDPQCTPDDITYLVDATNLVLREPISQDDIVGTWAGLRPLVKGGSVGEKTADLSRRHAVATSDSGVISITGGKLTTYRRMASDAVDAVAESIGRGGSSRTKRLPLLGAVGSAPPDEHLARRYGSLAADVLALIEADATLSELLVPGLPYRKAEAIYAVRHEMATTLDDVLSRRTRARLLARDASAAAADDIARLLAPELGWDEAEIVRQVSAYRAAIDEERTSAGLAPAEPSDQALDVTLGS
ncbi:MAG: FAD-dependent oxidoreductase [Acidimicrobiia bacterium]